MKRVIFVDFQICFSVPLIFSIAFGIYFENIKGILKTVRVMPYITAINFCMSHTWTLINYWHINCYLLSKMFPIYCRVWNFFEYIKEVLMQVRVTELMQNWFKCRTDILHHRNKLLVCSDSKFDKLKELHLVRIEKKRTNFLQRLEYFIKCKIDLKESNAQFMQNWRLALLW